MNREDLNETYNLLIDHLISAGYLKSAPIISAFRKIKRMDFVSPELEEEASDNRPLPIGQGQTISQPATVAMMLEILRPEKGDKILDIGSGSGWTTALLAEIVGPQGRVFGLEILPDICDFGSENINKYHFIDKKIVFNICDNGYKGLRQHAPYDKILVSAATTYVPDTLLRQLKIDGRMVIPIGSELSEQELLLIEKTDDNDFKKTSFPGFIFVPLVK